MDYADAVDTLEQLAFELGEDHGGAVAIRAVLDDAPTIEDLGEMADRLEQAEATIERLRAVVAEQLGRNRHSVLRADRVLRLLDGEEE